MIPLTAQQEKLWRFIRSCDRSPSFDEMQRALGLNSKSGVHRLVEALAERGFITRVKNRARTIVAHEAPVVVGPKYLSPLSAYSTQELLSEVERRIGGLNRRDIYNGHARNQPVENLGKRDGAVRSFSHDGASNR